jgi:hypothetical protein
MEAFDESRFRAKVQQAIGRLKTVMENHRTPALPSEIPHNYEDKYLLAESLTNSAVLAILGCLDSLGLHRSQLEKVKEQQKNRSITLRFKSEESCQFLRKNVRDVESGTKSVLDYQKFIDSLINCAVR